LSERLDGLAIKVSPPQLDFNRARVPVAVYNNETAVVPQPLPGNIP
jgi:hypothetical protein